MKYIRLVLASLGFLVLGLVFGSGHSLAYTQTKLMDDAVLDNVNSLNQGQIQSFLAGQPGPYTTLGTQSGGPGTPTPSKCLYTTALDSHNGANFHWNGSDWYYGDGYRIGNSTGWTFQSAAWNTAWGPAQISAATAIYQAAQQWGINPEVIIATLQKEAALVSGTDCSGWRYWSAMGYYCPDGSAQYTYPDMGITSPSWTCVNKESKVGLARQILWGAWQLKFNKERAYGNTVWDGDGNVTYVGFMTQGNRARCDTCAVNYYDGYATIDGQNVYMENGTTASLYSYTPHLGNSTPSLFEKWFGTALISYTWSPIQQSVYTDSSMTTPASASLLPGQKLYLVVKAKNTGGGTWTNNGNNLVRLGTSHPMDRASGFCDPTWLNSVSCNRPTSFQEASVAPGATGTFGFWVDAPSTAGSYNEYFNLVVDGVTWMNDPGLYWTLTVNTPVYSWSLVSQAAYTNSAMTTPVSTALTAGQKIYLVIKAKNTGNVAWSGSGSTPVRLGTSHPMDRASGFCDPTWLNSVSCNRPTSFQEASVAPGATGTFGFWVDAPSTAGSYNEYFNLVVDGVTWMNDPGLYWTLTVNTPVYSWSLVSQAAYTNSAMTTPVSTALTAGQKIYLVIKAKNTGNVAWSGSGSTPVRLGTSHPMDRASGFCDPTWLNSVSCNRPTSFQEASVAPGATGTFGFWVDAPSTAGSYNEYFNLVVDGVTWMNDPGLYWTLTVS